MARAKTAYTVTIFLLPALIEQGLFRTKEVYQLPATHYYSLESLREMPEKIRFNKLKTESKLLMNVIKMICYRAESAVASLVAHHLNRADEEKRMLVKQIIQNNADFIPDYERNTLTVVLHSLSAPRFNHAVGQITQLLNETETIFPGTDLRLIFKTTALSNCEG